MLDTLCALVIMHFCTCFLNFKKNLNFKGDKKLAEYSYGIQFKRGSAFADAITIDLIRRQHDAETGHVTLTFNFVFWPTLGNVTESIIVAVSNAQGAQWSFPVKLRVDEPRMVILPVYVFPLF